MRLVQPHGDLPREGVGKRTAMKKVSWITLFILVWAAVAVVFYVSGARASRDKFTEVLGSFVDGENTKSVTGYERGLRQLEGKLKSAKKPAECPECVETHVQKAFPIWQAACQVCRLSGVVENGEIFGLDDVMRPDGPPSQTRERFHHIIP